MSRSILHRSASALMLFVLCFALGTVGAAGQSTTDGAIGGTIKDPNAALVAGATVTVRNVDTNKEATAQTDDEGRFRIVQLQPGTYAIRVNASGFGDYTREGVVVEVGRVTSVDVDLSVTARTETVEVTGEAPVINTVQQDFATNINQTSINELPINGRRASEFVRLTPGVTPDGDFGLNSFRGLSGLLNNSTVDGGDNNNSFFSEERGRTRIQYVVSQAAVREFQVNTSNYSAEYGRAAGGVVNTVTKSGTNEFHGGLFYYLRDNKLGARNPSATIPVLVGATVVNQAIKPDDRRQQFGGSIGGPIVKDKAFFFFTYDQQKRNFPGVATPNNPSALNPITLSLRAGVTPPNCTVPAGQAPLTIGELLGCRLVTGGRTLAQAQTGVDSGLTFLRGLTGEVPRKQDQYIMFPKVDWNINGSNTLTVSHNHLRAEAPGAFETPSVRNIGRASFGDDFVDVDSFTARLSSTLSPTVLNEFRFQAGREFARATLSELSAGEQAEAARATRLVDGNLPEVFFTGGFSFGTRVFFDRRAFPNERRLQFADTVTVSRGNHTIKFGTDIKHDRDFVDNLFQGNGAYSYSNITDYLSDFVNPALKRYNSFAQAFGLSAYTLTVPDYAFFVQDDWRASSRLTVNLGLRWEYQDFTQPQIPNSAAATIVAGNNRYNQAEADALIARTRSFPSDKDNFGPRFGFAYDITGDGKTSVRGGYGIYFGRVPNTFIASAVVNTGAPGSQITVTGVSGATVLRDANNNIIPTPTYPNVLSALPVRSGNINVLSPELENPKIHQADVILEREIARNTVVSFSYLFSKGGSLPTFVDLNLPLPTATRTVTVVGGDLNGRSFTTPLITGARPVSNFGQILETQSNSYSEYHGLVLQANRRLTDGLQFQTNYTWSRSTDTGQRSGTFSPGSPTVLDPFNQRLDLGTSDLDIPHRFVASGVWAIGETFDISEENGIGRAIVNGWQLAPIVTIASGRPETGSISGAGNVGGTAAGLLGSGGPARAFFVPRNSFRRPRTETVDLRLSRRFNFKESMNLEFLIEAFNLFNRANVTAIDTNLFVFTAATNTLTANTGQERISPFLTPTQLNNTTLFAPRQIQLALRFQF